MFSHSSYFSSYKLRFLLAAVLICIGSLSRAQDIPPPPAPAPDSVRPAVVAPAEETEDEEEDIAIEEATVEPSLRSVPDSTIRRFKADHDFQYANDPEYWAEQVKKKKKKPEEPKFDREERDRSMFDFSGFSGLAQIFMLVLVLALLGFLVFKLMGNRWPWEKNAVLKGEEEMQNEEELNVDELQLKIREAIANKKFRMAIRYSYLFTLRRMDEKGWIRLDAKSTNYDYVKQMKERDPHGTFAYLTNIYDYVWYGEFELNEEQFNLVYKDFQNYLNTHSH